MILSIFLTFALTSLPLNSSISWLSWLDGAFALWHYSKILFVLTIPMTFALLLYVIDDLLPFLTAITRGLTQRELQNIWNHKKCFDIKTPTDDEYDNRSYFTHKRISIFHMLKNMFMFCKGDLLRKANNSSKRVRVKRAYNDIADSSSS
jgi:hypothetical protein